MSEFYELMKPIVARVVDSVHYSFPSHHPKEDTESTLWVHLYSRQETYEGYMTREGWEGIAHKNLTAEANSFLKNEDEYTYGYSPEDTFLHSTQTVEALLDVVFDYTDWQSFGQHGDGQPRARKQANQTGDHVAMLVDVKSAWEKLSEKERNALFLRHSTQFTFGELAEIFDYASESGAQKLVKRAVRGIQKQLGTRPYSDLRRGYEGRSEPETVASAQARVERDWNG